MEPREDNEGGKLRLPCSHGGHVVLPVPDDPRRRRLRYVGGDTRVVSIPRRASLGDLRLKISRLLSPSSPFSLRYHLPHERALRPLSSDADLRHMLLEHERLLSLPAPSRARVFLLPLDPYPLDFLHGIEEARALVAQPDSPGSGSTASSSFGSAGSGPSLSDPGGSSLTAADTGSPGGPSPPPVASPKEALAFDGMVSSLDDEKLKNGKPQSLESLLERSLFCQEMDSNFGLRADRVDPAHDSDSDRVQRQILELTEQFLLQQQQQPSPQLVHPSPGMAQHQAGTPLIPPQSFYMMHDQNTLRPSMLQNHHHTPQVPVLFVPVQLNHAGVVPIQQPNLINVGGIATPLRTAHVLPSSTQIPGEEIASFNVKSEFVTPSPLSQMPPIPQFIHLSNRKKQPCVMGYNPINHHSDQNATMADYLQQMYHAQAASAQPP